MKLYKAILLTLSALFLSIQFSSASGTLTVCPGQTANLNWSSTNSGSCAFTNASTNPKCNFIANAGGSQGIDTSSVFSCTADYACTVNGTRYPDSASLNVSLQNGACCGQYANADKTKWNGTSCVYPAPTVNLTAFNPSTISVGGTSNITMTTTNVTSCDATVTGSLGVVQGLFSGAVNATDLLRN